MLLNKSALLATITSVLARMELIPADTRTGIKSLNPARIEFFQDYCMFLCIIF